MFPLRVRDVTLLWISCQTGLPELSALFSMHQTAPNVVGLKCSCLRLSLEVNSHSRSSRSKAKTVNQTEWPAPVNNINQPGNGERKIWGTCRSHLREDRISDEVNWIYTNRETSQLLIVYRKKTKKKTCVSTHTHTSTPVESAHYEGKIQLSYKSE